MATSTPADTTYALSDDHVAFRDTIRQIVRERVAPRAAEIDAKAEYPWDLRKLFAEQDLLGLPFEEEYGGTGTGTLMLNIAVEEVAKACASTALILMVQELGTLPIRLFGSDELKQRFLPALRERRVVARLRAVRARGRLRPRRHAHHRASATATSGSSTARRTGSPTSASPTSTSSSRSRTARRRRLSAFVVEADRPGFSVGKLEHKLGIKGSPTGQPIFDDVRIPAENLIGTEGKGLSRRARHARPLAPRRRRPGGRDRAGRHRLRGRLRARAQAVRPADQRVPGDPVQARRHGDATAAARELLYKACAKIDRHEPDRGKYSAMAKLFASDTAMDVTIEAVQVLGGYGYVSEYPVERYHARRQDHPDLRGHERDPAPRDRPDDEVMMSDWPAWQADLDLGAVLPLRRGAGHHDLPRASRPTTRCGCSRASPSRSPGSGCSAWASPRSPRGSATTRSPPTRRSSRCSSAAPSGSRARTSPPSPTRRTSSRSTRASPTTSRSSCARRSTTSPTCCARRSTTSPS